MEQKFIEALRNKDPITADHSIRVAKYSYEVGKVLGLPPTILTDIRKGALLHDIGKLAIPNSILQKNDILTEEEYRIIKLHPGLGYDIHKKNNEPRIVQEIAHWHHERLDGSGYPDGLSGEEIPTHVRIVAVTDSFDAINSKRQYKDAVEPTIALELLAIDARNNKLDSTCVRILTKIVMSKINNNNKERVESDYQAA